MDDRRRDLVALFVSLFLCATCFTIGITWGLPSRSADKFLFGDHEVWDGATISSLAGDRGESAQLGADVDRNPLAKNRTAAILLNGSDPQRAEIIRRYRLYTAQPDEMITMMALASMSPARRDFDPKLYQYGGLWIYPVGALLKVASLFHYVDLARPQGYFLDHPEAFARFYIVARLYCVAWALLGAAAVYALMKRWTNDAIASTLATICFGLMPVVVNMAHEAKPHLPAAALMLWAIYFASRYVDTGWRRWWALAGLASGGAVAMVLSSLPILLVPVAMCALRRDTISQRLIVLMASLIIAIDAYFLLNPYVLKHAMHDPAVLLSNLRNSQAMYQTPPTLRGVGHAFALLGTGTSPLLSLAGGIGAIVFLKWRRDPAGILLSLVALAAFAQFAIFATDKPGEYARFALLPDIALLLSAFAIFSTRTPLSGTPGRGGERGPRLSVETEDPSPNLSPAYRREEKEETSPWLRVPYMAILLITTGIFGAGYIWHFGRDASDRPTRLIMAERLAILQKDGSHTLALAAEPAPYSVPPVDLWKWKLLLAPPGKLLDSSADVALRTIDRAVPGESIERNYKVQSAIRPRLFDTPISWAGKPFEVSTRFSP